MQHFLLVILQQRISTITFHSYISKAEYFNSKKIEYLWQKIESRICIRQSEKNRLDTTESWKLNEHFNNKTYCPYYSVTKTKLFENGFQTRGISKRRIFVFVWTERILKTKLFENCVFTIIVRSPWLSCPQTQIQNLRSLFLFKFLRRIINEKHLIRFQSETSSFFFKSLRRRVNGTSEQLGCSDHMAFINSVVGICWETTLTFILICTC